MEPRLPGFPTVWEPYAAEPLVDLAARRCLQQLSRLAEPELPIPAPLCERLLRLAAEEGPTAWRAAVSLLSAGGTPGWTRLERLRVPWGAPSLDDAQLVVLVGAQPVEELDVSGCLALTPNALPLLASSPAIAGGRLRALALPPHLMHQLQDDASWARGLWWLWEQRSLERLRLCGAAGQLLARHGRWAQMRCLRQLDLSQCQGPLARHLGALAPLAPSLAWLSLADVPHLDLALDALCRLSALRHLDVSQCSDKEGWYKDPDQWLATLVEALPDLTSLDLSGTNLAGEDKGDYSDGKAILGLKSRFDRPLEFLGLFGAPFDACYRPHLPATWVTGDATEEQVLVAAQAYQARPALLQRVLNDLFHVFRYEACTHARLALDVVLAAMARHPNHKHIQIAGSASLFYLVKGDERPNFSVSIRRKIIKCLLDAMGHHRGDTTMLRNGCLTMIHFGIPEDVLFDYERLVDVLLFIVSQEEQDEFVQRIGIYLLNSLACQVDGHQKLLVGDKGAIGIMLQLIEGRLRTSTSDEVMETAWSTMWNVTDETPINCARFLDGGGMALFLECLRSFPDKPELLRNMMGLLGNVAEVRELRPRLMRDEYLKVFSDLLDSESDGIEVSYNAAGILAHILSDGAACWAGIRTVCREGTQARMRQAIDSWPLAARRNINYRSFEPILRLLRCEHTPEAQHWAVWALANLTRVYPDKYCPLVREEGGLEMLQELVHKPGPYPRIHELAQVITQRCQRHATGRGDSITCLEEEPA